MPVQVHVTSVIRKAVRDQKQIAVEGRTIREVIENIE